jgi:hypothetical protein
MREITTTEEMLVCNEAIREVDHLLLDPDDMTEHALRQMWAAGRDWARQQPTPPSVPGCMHMPRCDDRYECAERN